MLPIRPPSQPQQLVLPGLETIACSRPPIQVPSLIKQSWITYGYDIDWSLLTSLDPVHPPVILSYGLGVDSTSLFLRFLFDPSCRDFPLQNLVLVVAMTGDEWARTAELVRKFILPLCRRFGIWLIQVSRSGESEREGITIHSSSRCPERLYIEGSYSLGEHLLVNGIVPQKAKGKRFCTMKFKTFPIDLVVKLFFSNSPDARYCRMIGFNADERGRAQRDGNYGAEPSTQPRYLAGHNANEIDRATKDSSLTATKQYRYLLGFNVDEVNRQKQEAVTWRNQVFEFPLIHWGWTRDVCERYVAEITDLLERSEQLWVESGRTLDDHAIHQADPAALLNCVVSPTWWEKSCCGYCPHSCSNGGDDAVRQRRLRRDKRAKSAKLNKMIDRWQAEPTMGGYAAYIEHNALAFSHYSGALYDTGAKKQRRSVHTVLDKLRDAGLDAAIADYEARLTANPLWAVYVVRRVFKPAILPNPQAVARAKAKGKVAKPNYPAPPRQVKTLFQGSRAEAHGYLSDLAQIYGTTPQLIALSYRFWSHPRPRDESKRPFVEEMFVCVFVEAKDKQDERIDFEAVWESVAGEPIQIRTPVLKDATIN